MSRTRPARSIRSLFAALALLAPFSASAADEAAATPHPVRLCVLTTPFDEDDERRKTLEERIARRFEEGRFEVIRSAQLDPLLDRIDDESGAIYDPAFGDVAPAAWSTYQDALERGLRTGPGCDAGLRISLRPVMARLSWGTAYWDGVSAEISSEARRLLFGSEYGRVAALSLDVALVDLRGETLGYRSAGLEPLISLGVKRPVDLVPEDRWLRDESKLDRAVDIALGPAALFLRDRGRATAHQTDWPFRWPDAR